MAPDKRSKLVAVRLTVEEHAMLARLADEDGVSASDVLRMLVRREHKRRFPEPPKPQSRK